MNRFGIINLPAGEHTVQCHYAWSSGHPGCMYLPNGDPGYPDEPGEFELTSVKFTPPGASEPVELLDLLEELGALPPVVELAFAAFDEAFEREEVPDFDEDLDSIEPWDQDRPAPEEAAP